MTDAAPAETPETPEAPPSLAAPKPSGPESGGHMDELPELGELGPSKAEAFLRYMGWGAAFLLGLRLVLGLGTGWMLDAAVAEARAAGVVTSWPPRNELAAPQPEASKLAFHQQRAALELMEAELGRQEIHDLYDLVSEEQIASADLSALVDAVNLTWPSLQLIEEASETSQRPDYTRFARSQKKAPNYRALNELGSAGLARAEVSVRKGHADDAWRATLALLRLGDALADEHTLIAEAVRTGLLRRALRAGERAHSAGQPSAELLDRVRGALTHETSNEALLHCLHGETSWAMQLLMNLRDISAPSEFQDPLQPVRIAALWALRPWLAAEASAYLRIMAGFAEAIRQEAGAEDPRWRPEVPAWAVMTRIAVPDIQKFAQRTQELRAEARALLAQLEE